MKNALRYISAWILSALVCAGLASLFSTQRVIGALNAAGAETGTHVGLGARLSMTAYDLLHFGSLYVLFILIALLIAFLAGGLTFRFAKFGRAIIYSTAGAIAMVVMLSLMQKVFFGVPIVAGARDGFGIALQMLAGGVAGFAFAKITAGRAHPSPTVS